MNKNQTIAAWVGAAFFVVLMKPEIFFNRTFPGLGTRDFLWGVFDSSFTALFARLSVMVVLTGFTVYILRDKKPKDEQKQ